MTSPSVRHHSYGSRPHSGCLTLSLPLLRLLCLSLSLTCWRAFKLITAVCASNSTLSAWTVSSTLKRSSIISVLWSPQSGPAAQISLSSRMIYTRVHWELPLSCPPGISHSHFSKPKKAPQPLKPLQNLGLFSACSDQSL